MSLVTDQIKAELALLAEDERKAFLVEICPAPPEPTGWRGLFADAKLPITIAGFIVGSVATWYAAKNEPAAIKLQYFQTWMLSAAGIWSAVMIALGFQKGKLNEGTVPAGAVARPIAAPVSMTPIAVPIPQVVISNSSAETPPGVPDKH